MILWVSQSGEEEPDENVFAGEFIDPHKRIISLDKSTKGVVFKEAYFPNWHAYLETDQGKEELSIEKAGPGLMYVRLPADSGYPAEVLLQYKKSIFEIAGIVFSLATILILIIHLLEGKAFKPFLSKPFDKGLSIFRKNINNWWENEEE